MRMWLVKPKIMCRKHLLGEHVEIHMLIGAILKGKSLKGYIHKNLIEIESIEERHQELVEEMLARGYKHNSPLPEIADIYQGTFYLDYDIVYHKINKEESLTDLLSRCPECKKRYNRIIVNFGG